jgi:alanyl aminopeptidase
MQKSANRQWLPKRVRIMLAVVLLPGLLAGCSEAPEPAPDGATAAPPIRQAAIEEPPTGQLPAGVVPTHYRLHLTVDPRSEHFSGRAEIDVDLAQSAHTLWLHGKSLQVEQALARLADGSEIPLQWHQASPVGVVRLAASQPLPAGSLTLVFGYRAPFNTSLEGLHRVRHGDADYAFTQFEATSARMAFPAFDQPGFKTPFDITLTVPEGVTAITNTPQQTSRSDGDGNVTVQFATSKPLPTYLVAFAVGPFDVVDAAPVPASELREAPIPLRGITTRGKGDRIRYALAHTADIVLAMESYFDTPYPYAKLDLIAIPDFGGGAMENAGAITYREQLLLLDENSAVGDKRNFLATHAHELSHQWFGNLVTPQWWDDLWLKEAFATWHSYKTIDALYPGENYLDSLFSESAWAMKEDALSSARRVREPILRHEDIGAAYDGITYSKGGGVLAMFEAFMGPDNFRRGIRHYMSKHAWGNTTAADFMAAITEANPEADGQLLRDAFHSFIAQAGVPQLQVKLDCSGDAPALQIEQQRYLPLGSTGDTAQSWIIPACAELLHAGESQTQCFLASGREQRVVLDTERCPDAVLPNSGGSSYYRFAMSGPQWQALLARFDQLSNHEQIAIADSLGAALNAGTLSLEDYLAAVPTLAGSRSWRVSILPRTDIYRLMDYGANEAEKQRFRELLLEWYRPQLNRLEALPELSPEQLQYRMFMMSTLGLRGRDPAVRARLVAMGRAYTGFGTDAQLAPDAIDPNMAYIALLAGVEEIGKPFTDLLWRHLHGSDDATVRERLLYAIAHSSDPEIAAEARTVVLDPRLADNEISYIIKGQMGEPGNQAAAWAWARDNLHAVMERIPTWLKGQVPDMFSEFCAAQAAADIEAVFAPVIDQYESGPRYLAKTLEKIRLCAAFIDHYSGRDQANVDR